MEQDPDSQIDIEASLLNIVKNRWPQEAKILDLRDDVFEDKHHRLLFELFRKTKAENGIWDDIILRKKYEAMGGDVSAWNKISNMPSNPNNTEEYISELIKHAKERKLMEHLLNASKSGEDPMKILSLAMQDLGELEGMRVPRIRGATIDEVTENYRNREYYKRLSCGIPTIDRLMNGIRNQESTTLGAPAGSGKSALAANMAYNIASDSGGTSIIFSKEMLEEKIYSRLLASISGLRVGLYEDIKSGDAKPHEVTDSNIRLLENIMDMIANLRDNFIFFDMQDSQTINPREIAEEIKGQNALLRQINKLNPDKKPRKVDFVVVDYLQILDYEQGKNSTADSLDSISKGLHEVALQEDCHLFILAAVNRSLGKNLDLDAFRGSAGIGFNTENGIMMVSRDDLDLAALGSDWTGENPLYKPLQVKIVKARNSEVNRQGFLKFAGRFQKFEELERDEMEGLKAIMDEDNSRSY